MRIFWQESATFMKFLPKAVKSELSQSCHKEAMYL